MKKYLYLVSTLLLGLFFTHTLFVIAGLPKNIKDREHIRGQLREGDCLTILNSIHQGANCYQLARHFLKNSSIERDSDLGGKGDELGCFLHYHQQCVNLRKAFYPKNREWPYSKKQNPWHQRSYNRHNKQERENRQKYIYERCKHHEKRPYDILASFKKQHLNTKISATTPMGKVKKWDAFIENGGAFFDKSGVYFTE